MADKNNMVDDEYLEDLFKAIAGEIDEDTSDKVNEDDLDNDVKGSDSEEKILSDIEKDIFDENDSKILDDMFGDIKDKDGSLDGIPDDSLFNFESNISDEASSGISNEMPAEDIVNANMGEPLNMNVSENDSSVEEDLQGLYGILGVDNDTEDMSGKDDEKPKKRGLFGRRKKDKKPKKEKEKKVKKEKKNKVDDEIDEKSLNSGLDDFGDMADEMSNKTVNNVDPALEGFDVEALFNSSGAFGDAEGGFDMSEGFSFGDAETISFGSDDNGGLSLGLDDSGFGVANENENDMLIRQMDEGKLDDELLSDDEENSKKSKKSKKEKKEKKTKEKKSKDKGDKKGKGQKKAKAKKPKKEKEQKIREPKEPDEIIHIPIIAIIFMLSFIVVAVVAVKLGGDYYFYQERIYAAVELYVDTDQTDIEAYESRYSEAYRVLSGMEMRNKEHQAFYDQVKTIMFMDRHYEAYKGYMLLENFDNGLDSLIKAVKMYDKYQNEARELGCFDDMTVILSWVSTKLNDVYGITESRARELSMMTDDREYAIIVREIAGQAKAKYLESKTEEEMN